MTVQEPHFPWLTASGADSRSEVPESRRFGGARLRERLAALDEIDRGAARSRDLSLAAVRGSEGAGGSPPPTGTGGLPPPVPPTPTLSLLYRVSHCKPQAPRGFPTVIGSGQACLVLARGLGPPGRGGLWACLSPAFPEATGSESVQTSRSQQRQDCWTGIIPGGPGLGVLS